MKKILVTMAICSASYFLPAQGGQGRDSKDESFVMEAAYGGLMEVKLGELATSRGQSQVIKTLAQHMVTDHSKANEELKAIARKKNITLPTTLHKEGQKKFDELSKKSGTEFDKMYADMMVSDHKKDIKKFKTEAESGNDAELKAWAGKTLATLEHHLEMSKAACDSTKKSK